MYIYIENIRREFSYFNNPKYSIFAFYCCIYLSLLLFSLFFEPRITREEKKMRLQRYPV